MVQSESKVRKPGEKAISVILAICFMCLHIICSASESHLEHVKMEKVVGDIRIIFSGVVITNTSDYAESYEVLFPMINASETKEIFPEKTYDWNDAVGGTSGDLRLYTSTNGDSLSCSYGDVEFLSNRFLSTYNPLIPLVVSKGEVPEKEWYSIDLINGTLKLICEGQRDNECSLRNSIAIYYLDSNHLTGLGSDVKYAETTKKAKPFCCIFLPVYLNGFAVLYTPVELGDGRVVAGTQRQIVVSEDGIEFYYSGRSLNPDTKPHNSAKKLLTSSEALDVFTESLKDILLSEPESMEFHRAEVCYVPIPQDRVNQRFIYIPHWIFFGEGMVLALNAFTGEQLL